jgi:hypothetical protein
MTTAGGDDPSIDPNAGSANGAARTTAGWPDTAPAIGPGTGQKGGSAFPDEGRVTMSPKGENAADLPSSNVEPRDGAGGPYGEGRSIPGGAPGGMGSTTSTVTRRREPDRRPERRVVQRDGGASTPYGASAGARGSSRQARCPPDQSPGSGTAADTAIVVTAQTPTAHGHTAAKRGDTADTSGDAHAAHVPSRAAIPTIGRAGRRRGCEGAGIISTLYTTADTTTADTTTADTTTADTTTADTTTADTTTADNRPASRSAAWPETTCGGARPPVPSVGGPLVVVPLQRTAHLTAR